MKEMWDEDTAPHKQPMEAVLAVVHRNVKSGFRGHVTHTITGEYGERNICQLIFSGDTIAGSIG